MGLLFETSDVTILILKGSQSLVLNGLYRNTRFWRDFFVLSSNSVFQKRIKNKFRSSVLFLFHLHWHTYSPCPAGRKLLIGHNVVCRLRQHQSLSHTMIKWKSQPITERPLPASLQPCVKAAHWLGWWGRAVQGETMKCDPGNPLWAQTDVF